MSVVVHLMETICQCASVDDLFEDRLDRFRPSFFGVRANCFLVRVFQRAVCVCVVFFVRRFSLDRYLVDGQIARRR